MKEKKELEVTQLKADCQLDSFDFETTEEIDPFVDELIGQDRAVKAMDLGLRMEQEGYNVFISGATGTGRTTYAKTLAEKKSKTQEVPDDLCYVYNFNDSQQPKALQLPAGTGVHLQKDMEQLIKELRAEIPEAFVGEEYEEKKKQIMNDYQQQSTEIMNKFKEDIKERGFVLQNTAHGLLPVPINEAEEPIDQDEFKELAEDKKKAIQEESQKIQNELEQIMNKIRNLKSKAQEKLESEEKKIALAVIQPIIANLENKYYDCEQILDYLQEVQQDIIENLSEFKKQRKEEQSQKMALLQKKKDPESFFIRYQVNLLVDNQDTEGAPVVCESNPSYYNLFGKIEGKSELGTITTDFTMIKPGAIHKANGGYLIMRAKDLFTKIFSWETLKRTLINQEVVVENIGEQYRTVPIASLKPEAIPLDLKVIMIGNPIIYQLLYHYDEDFKKLFKIKADFDVEMKRDQENLQKFASFVTSISQREGIRHFTCSAVGRIVEYSSRLTGDRTKISTKFNEIMELLFESEAWAEDDKEYIEQEDVVKAIQEKELRSNLVEEKLQEMIDRGNILVDVAGQVEGQINGLAVYQTGQYSFGRPVRITAQTFVGKKGVINIEREVKMSGKIHNKGVMILSGFLGGKYAQERPLSLSASLAFEQNYGGIDGDSASCAELIALLSAISGLPVEQGLAITGSMNQKGEVQPIGGVNEKIEGFYEVCKLKKLTGEQGVIIPAQNEDNLMLKDEVVEAVEAGDFHIYSVEKIDEAIEIMLATEAEEVHQQIRERLDELATKAAEFAKGNQENEKE
ncbi:Lon protease family protein [Fuchsiella alkaliacetigena]|uniref:Lon protease family protein n=1 Tax=Fuchsiella alkaliacetigena TaxID=957042 RepID=UPI00200B6F8F|nr:ATP-binding protein [Fuchsiella alkaliacetigena]MCK8823974.1 AAA family ATPase [Fuchsiella alkaliacetigena]